MQHPIVKTFKKLPQGLFFGPRVHPAPCIETVKMVILEIEHEMQNPSMEFLFSMGQVRQLQYPCEQNPQ